jgi:hypothetical protein
MNFVTHNFDGAVSRSRRSPGADHQLELGFAAASACQAAGYRPRRLARANWWFQRMRQLVDRATDWQPALPARPEQSWFPNTHRNVSVAPQPMPGQREICE